MSNEKDRLRESFDGHLLEVLKCTRDLHPGAAAGYDALMEIAEYMMQMGDTVAQRIGNIQTEEQAHYLKGQLDLLRDMARDFGEIVRRMRAG